MNLRAVGCRIVEADLEDEESVMKAVEDVSAEFTYVHGTGGDTKSLDLHEVERAKTLAKALSASKETFVAYNSAAGEGNHGVPRILQKQQCEREFRKAGLELCALRANLFMEELWKDYTRPSIVDKKKFMFSVPRDKPIYLTSVRDMGRVAAAVFNDPALRTDIRVVASDCRTPKEMADAFGVDFKRDRVFYWLSRLVAPELYQIISFYIKADTHASHLDKLKTDLPPNLLTSFDEFLKETEWFDTSKTYDSLSQQLMRREKTAAQ